MNHINGFQRQDTALYKWLYTAVAMLVVLMQPLAAYAAISVDSADMTSFDAVLGAGRFLIVYDMDVDSTGNLHVVAGQVDAVTNPGAPIELMYYEISNVTITSSSVLKVLDSEIEDIAAELELDSNENPAIVWYESQSNEGVYNDDIFYRAFDGTNWNTVTVTTSLSSSSGLAGKSINLEFYGIGPSDTGVGLDDPVITFCVTNAANPFHIANWNGADFDVSVPAIGDHKCIYLDSEIDAGDELHVVGKYTNTFGSPSDGDGYDDMWYAAQTNGGVWTTSTVFADGTIQKPNAGVNAINIDVELDSSDNPFVFVWDYDGVNDFNLLFATYNGVSWSTSTVFTNTNLYVTTIVHGADVSANGNTLYHTYGQGPSTDFDWNVVYSQNGGSTWTTSSIVTNEDATAMAFHNASAYDSTNSKLVLLEGISDGASVDYDRHDITISMGEGGGGDPVPEMSTYLLILVGGLGAYMLYREADKIDFGGAAAA